MESSVDFCGAFGLWNTFCGENGRTNHILRKLWIVFGIFFGLLYAAFCIAGFLRWYL